MALIPAETPKLFEQPTLLGGQLGGRLNRHADELVSPTWGLEPWKAFPSESENCAALRTRWDAKTAHAIEGRHLDFGPEGCVGDGDR